VLGQENEDQHALSSTFTSNADATAATSGRWVGMEQSPLDLERLDVYRCAIEFLTLAVRVTAHMPRGHADLRDQLRRASTSVPLNIAEASGKTGTADRAHFHAIARGSALECAAILERGRLLRLDGPLLRTNHLPDDELRLEHHDVPEDRTISGKRSAEFPERTPGEASPSCASSSV